MIPQKERPVTWCAIYTRKSTDENLNTDFNSLDSQREYCEAFIKSREGEGWRAYPEVYNDPGYSGGNMDRPALSKLLRDAKQRKFQVVVSYKFDRLSRNTRDFLSILDVFDKHGAAFVSVTQPIDTTSSVGRLMRSILMDFAQFEREMISERTRDKMAAMARKGKRLGGAPLLGYDMDAETKKLKINETEANRVREIFETYLRTKALTATVRILREKGIRQKAWMSKQGRLIGGAEFDRSDLLRLLRNPVYIGKVAHNGNLYDGEHQGIIPEDQAKAVYDLLAANGNGTRYRYIEDRKYHFLLKGLVKCAVCGATMTSSHCKPRQGERFFYYRCESTLKMDKTACVVKSVPAKSLDQYVVGQIETMSENKELWEKTVNLARAEFIKELPGKKEQKAQYLAELGKTEADIRNLTDILAKEGPNSLRYDILMGTMDKTVERKREIEAKLLTLESEIQELETQNIDAEALRHYLGNFLKIFKRINYEEQQEFLQILVKEVNFEGKTKWVKTLLRPLPALWGDLELLEGTLCPPKSRGPSPGPEGLEDGHSIAREEHARPPDSSPTGLNRKAGMFDFPGNALRD